MTDPNDAAFNKALNEPPAAPTDLNESLPPGWLKTELDGIDAEIAQMPIGFRQSLATIIPAPPSEPRADEQCPACAGKGWFNAKCNVCKGSGKAPEPPAALLPPETKVLLEEARRLANEADFAGVPKVGDTFRKAADALEVQAARIAEAEETITKLFRACEDANRAYAHEVAVRLAAEARAETMERALRECACECDDLSDCPDGLQCAGWIAKTALKDDEVIAQGGEQP
jgi:hypothetical protein